MTMKNLLPHKSKWARLCEDWPLYLLTLVIAASLCFVAFSCRRPPVKSHEAVSETVRTEYVETVRDSIVYVELPQESRAVETRDTVSHLELSGSASDANVSGGVLRHSLYTLPSYRPAVEVKLTDKTTRTDSVRTVVVTRVEIETLKIPVNHVPAFFWWLLGFNILQLGWWAVRKFVLKR